MPSSDGYTLITSELMRHKREVIASDATRSILMNALRATSGSPYSLSVILSAAKNL